MRIALEPGDGNIKMNMFKRKLIRASSTESGEEESGLAF
jgi:hypothetical protein